AGCTTSASPRSTRPAWPRTASPSSPWSSSEVGIHLGLPLPSSSQQPRIGGRWRHFFRGFPAMPAEPDQPITGLLRAAQSGDAGAAERLMAVVYEELHQLARTRMACLPSGQTLQPTALVHEAYLRLADQSDIPWESRQHFFFAAARAMRDILVEQARRKAGPARGGGRRRKELDDACAAIEPPAENVLAVHEALEELEKQDPLKAKIVLLRYFGGLTTAETAEVLGLAERTLDRQWRFIRVWLLKRLG